ncbi:uncharacterized protein [Coffea arabica]|uniref:HMA domain-containing protein n=1 Tax=Coffea arabica TaxID=13443 RepID=A0A6P6VTE2_COFAR|nr:heavy metal-associated isoprenylated plant protein 5-like [Coffea arabica]
MSMKAAKNMRGFMCQSPAATAVCMASEPLSVIVRRGPESDRTLAEHARLIDSTKHSRMVEPRARSRGLASATLRSAIVPSFGVENQPDKASRSQVVSSLAERDQVFQVVVMRVSLHCQGCAGKVKKHLSKMEGVTSFSIDLESKRVTVMGHVSPTGVVESISKVKRAELWPSAPC